MRATRLAAIAATAAIFAGCTDIYGNDDGNGNGDFTVTVGTGTQPNYSWPGGPAFEIDVYRTSDPLVPVWSIADPNSTRNITSPLRHGNVPSGVILLADDETTLRAGVSYRVTIRVGNTTGSETFRP
jgi:hypothetical protein